MGASRIGRGGGAGGGHNVATVVGCRIQLLIRRLQPAKACVKTQRQITKKQQSAIAGVPFLRLSVGDMCFNFTGCNFPQIIKVFPACLLLVPTPVAIGACGPTRYDYGLDYGEELARSEL